MDEKSNPDTGDVSLWWVYKSLLMDWCQAPTWAIYPSFDSGSGTWFSLKIWCPKIHWYQHFPQVKLPVVAHVWTKSTAYQWTLTLLHLSSRQYHMASVSTWPLLGSPINSRNNPQSAVCPLQCFFVKIHILLLQPKSKEYLGGGFRTSSPSSAQKSDGTWWRPQEWMWMWILMYKV